MGLLDAFSKEGFMTAMQDPMFQMGVGMLARKDQSFGRAMGGAMRDLGEIQNLKERTALRQQQAEVFKEERERAKKEAEQQAAMQERWQQMIASGQVPRELAALPPAAGMKVYGDVLKQQMTPAKTPTSYQEWQLAGSPGTYADWIARKQAASGTKITLSSGPADESAAQKAYGKAMGTKEVKIHENADKARMSQDRAAQMRFLLDRWKESGGEPGKLAGLTSEISAYASGIGLDPAELGLADAGPAQAFQALSNQMALGKIGGEDGMPANNFSDADRKFVVSTVPQLTNDPEGIELKLLIQEAMDHRAIEREEFFYAHTNKPIVERNRLWAKHRKDNPLFKQKTMNGKRYVKIGNEWYEK